MGQTFRITFEKKDYTFILLNTPSIHKDTTHIDVMFENTTYRLIKNKETWAFENVDDTYLTKLSAAIGKSISLRYRI
jgi:hypothetical protein